MQLLLNMVAFRSAKEAYAIALGMTYADGTVKKISDSSSKALEAAIIAYMIRDNKTKDLLSGANRAESGT